MMPSNCYPKTPSNHSTYPKGSKNTTTKSKITWLSSTRQPLNSLPQLPPKHVPVPFTNHSINP
jgi:hypothetical protein